MASIVARVVDCYVFNLLERTPRFLLLKRNKNKIYEHLWQGVAGKIGEWGGGMADCNTRN
ncbi:MAG: hypothetical protein Ct9H90mP7_1330 [Candidatus Neomarinimicrobiota bacterium]|nr:MAG: hypothetical protein Ct9H90mP7_1330 [Candidatus Neomarinimicrobiota bacterium]